MANAVIRVTEVIRFVKDKEKPPPQEYHHIIERERKKSLGPER